MKRATLTILLAAIVGALIGWLLPVEAASPPDPHQQNPDIYACCNLPSVFAGWTAGDLSTLNPLTVKLRAGTRIITYSYVVVPGCSDGSMYDNLQIALSRTTKVTGVSFLKVSSGADVSVRATCGTDAANVGVTGGVVGDLYPGWPYQSTVNVNTIMATYPAITQQTIWCHEFCGHALGTWDEQYQKNGSFAATPGLVDFMNTGPDSRYLWPQSDVDRWERTLFPLSVQVECAWLGLDPCSNTIIYLDGWRVRVFDGVWLDPRGVERFSACNQDGLRLDLLDTHWWRVPNQNLGFDYALGLYVIVPDCAGR